MKYIDEYRDPQSTRKYAEAIAQLVTRPWTIMEVCGGQTHSIVRFGIQDLLPDEIELVHGPGCPVCVTPVDMVDKAIEIASYSDVIFCSFGDMMRVPGSKSDLTRVRARGGDLRAVYTPLDAVKIAAANPQKQVVFFAVGFETTAPANAMAVYLAKKQGLKNFSVLVSHVLVPPAMKAILSSPDNTVQGFLAAGHVCTVMGTHAYTSLADTYHVPIVVTGFEPLDILQGIYMCVRQLEDGSATVENQYERAVQDDGNTQAQDLIEKVFRVIPRKWRGIGTIPESGWALSDEYSSFDAQQRFKLAEAATEEHTECLSGKVLQGLKKPADCPAFGVTCTPENPLGATMVSGEGACAAYYRYRKERVV
ncbi:Hydrogenase isoenzymes formation protein HypD [Pseudovibrio axinellae]|uniref:Hydrogenase maturation factor n=1 Tax=Pseudovibrio axinellae TaxID=989403 RepID=A0A165W9Z3_9HYPH|nr:hydrogenase formation protein HypD [Pseudovibrio axinellae]KZL16266.1 Hydrogenase isoenzymes formation protein HypD [Pseudovibrio axinellae]SER78423.1 Hydrogenase maturation protein HypD [Pseudovibrio axinellae]